MYDQVIIDYIIEILTIIDTETIINNFNSIKNI